MKKICTSLFVFLTAHLSAQNQAPFISNVNASVNGNQIIISYDLDDAENDLVEIIVQFSNNIGETYTAFMPGSLSGDVGFPISIGNGKQIIWNVDTLDLQQIHFYAIRVVADDKQIPTIEELVNQVDSNRLKQDLSFIQGLRHYQTGLVHLNEVRDSLEQRFVSAGLQTYRHEFPRAGTTGANIIGTKAGLRTAQNSLIVDAHYDSVSDAPGADDNGSGVVGVLEVLRILAPWQFDKTIRFIGFDFEESVGVGGLFGSLKYVQEEIRDWEIIDGVINFEMIGYYSNLPNTQQVPAGFNILFPNQYAALQTDSFRGNFATNVADTESDQLRQLFDDMASTYAPNLKTISVTLPNNGLIAPDFRRSDHANFWDIDVPALMITDGANFRNLDYHTENDTSGKLSYTFMSNIVKTTVASIATLGGLQHSGYADFQFSQPSSRTNFVHNSVRLVPVPASDFMRVSLKNKLNDYNGMFSIRTMDGRTIVSGKFNSENFTINVSELPEGVYTLELSGSSFTNKRLFTISK